MKTYYYRTYLLLVGTTPDGKEAGFIIDTKMTVQSAVQKLMKNDDIEPVVEALTQYDGKSDVAAFIEQKVKGIEKCELEEVVRMYFTPSRNNLCGDFSYQQGQVMYKGKGIADSAE